VDRLIRQGVREICSLPADTPLPVFYTGHKYRGLGMLRTIWESRVPHIAISKRLSSVGDAHFDAIRDVKTEETLCRARIGGVIGLNASAIRTELRLAEFKKWSELRQRGIGTKWYKCCTLINAWVSNKKGPTSVQRSESQ
jgi:hypothetical protein